jgi:hypothetical protein
LPFTPANEALPPLFGYSAPHPSTGGTSTLLNNALLSARYGLLTFAPMGLSPTEYASLRWTHTSSLCRPFGPASYIASSRLNTIAPQYLLRDRDRIFGLDFVDQVKAMGIKQVLSGTTLSLAK